MMTPYFALHPEEFEPYTFDGRDNAERKQRIPNAKVTKEGLHSLFRWQIEREEPDIARNETALCRRMVEKFKESKCYNLKTEEEREEIIEYLLSEPDPI